MPNEEKNGHSITNGSASHKNPFFTTMLVEGSSDSNLALDAFLKAEGHFILKAASPEEALELTKRHLPDLILLDCDLQGISCLALMYRLLQANSNASVILLAVKPLVSVAIEAMKLGAVDFFERPIDLGKLKEAIDLQKTLFSAENN